MSSVSYVVVQELQVVTVTGLTVHLHIAIGTSSVNAAAAAAIVGFTASCE